MAYRAFRGQEQRVGMGARKLANNLRSKFVADFAPGINPAQKTERGIGELANHAARFEFAQTLERKHAVGVALRVAGRIAEVPDTQIVASRGLRDAPVRRVLAMEPRLIAIHDSARTDQRDSAL